MTQEEEKKIRAIQAQIEEKIQNIRMKRLEKERKVGVGRGHEGFRGLL